MIDEIRLAEKGKWLVEHTEGEYGKGWNDCNKHWIEVIKEMPRVGEWIPCSERLPEEDGNYLVSGVWGSGKEAVGECDFSVNDGYFRTAWNFDVIAWMPLPEPYKEETDGRAD